LAYDAEVERSRISKIECGYVNPSLLTLATLCYSLGITLPALFDGITATMPPVSEGGTPRRTNQAVLEKLATPKSKKRTRIP
jgi:transcriptional regulator with XRE-family HTH domain